MFEKMRALRLALRGSMLYACRMQHSALLTVMTKAAQTAAKGIVRDFGEIEKLQVSKKGTSNFVTSADIRTEKLIIEQLNKSRPKFAILSEESGASGDENATERFVIDPIDGTTNFIHAIAYIAISIAAQKRDDNGVWHTTAGVIYDPIHDECFAAEKGLGAFLNGNYRLRVSQRDEDALIGTTSPRAYRKDFERTLSAFTKLSQSGFTLRCSGSAALDLAYVAAGRLDATWYHKLNLWDLAAGALLVTEAGGKFSSETGDAFNEENGSVLAANAQLHKPLAAALREAVEA